MLQSTLNPASALLRSPWLRPLNDADALNDLLAQINPTWSLNRIKARVVGIRQETADARTFVLRPNRRWPGFAAGQHVVVEFELNGVRCHRSYSLSSAPQDRGTVAITVKRQQGGKVSNGVHDELQVGDVVVLSAPAGDFVLPAELPGKLLMLSAGSGITPVMSMLRDLHARTYAGEIYFLHACRTPEDAIFAGELHAMSAALPGLRLHFHYTAENGRLPLAALSTLVPHYAQRQTFLCGPAGFMDAVRAKWQDEGLAQQLACERFSGPALRAVAVGAPVEIRAARSERLFTAAGDRPLLAEAEAAGLKPKHGCRIGICQSCKCRKQSGTVENLLTGEISSEAGEMIQLCISAARSDLTLDI